MNMKKSTNNDCITKKENYILQTNEDGSVITVRDLQLEVLSVMDEVHRVCEKNNIRYALVAGSALGIVNYKGFIPWDDDIDICVMREDWEKFIDALNKDLGNNFYFQCFENDKKFNVINGPQMKIRKKGTYIEEVNFLLKNRCKSGNGVFVDVIIYDNIADKVLTDQISRTFIKILMPFYVLVDNLHLPHKEFSKFIRWFSDRYAKKHKNSKRTSQWISVPWEKFLHEPIFLKEDVYPFKKYTFEGREFYSYNNIEKILKEWYGPNCLKKWNGKEWEETLPVEKRKPKHTAYINLKGDTDNRK